MACPKKKNQTNRKFLKNGINHKHYKRHTLFKDSNWQWYILTRVSRRNAAMSTCNSAFISLILIQLRYEIKFLGSDICKFIEEIVYTWKTFIFNKYVSSLTFTKTIAADSREKRPCTLLIGYTDTAQSNVC